MPLYKTTLVRSYAVTIEAENEEMAARIAEFFISEVDLSTIEERENFHFEIRKVELLENDSIDTTIINNASYQES